ncbi:MAG: cadherin repeat domain-containing protein [Caldilineaceae bacterium]
MNHSTTLSRILKLVPLLAVAIVGAIWFPLAAHADSDPSVYVVTTTEHIEGSATTFVVPIMFDDGTHDNAIGSTSFTLDYDQTCLRINSPAADITFLQTGLTNISTVDADTGKLYVSIYDPLTPFTALVTGELITVKFTLETACRPGATNPTDPVAQFSFINPTFGTLLGLPVTGTATGGRYTLDINQAPTDIAAGSLAMDENVTGSRQIAVLSATDADTAPADTLAFAFSGVCTPGTFDNQGFTLDPSDSSLLRTDRVFNYESTASYAICLQVTDGQGGLYTELLTLSVVNKNDTPTGINLSNNTIAQAAALGTLVGTLSKVDEDTSQTYTYSLLATGSGSADSTKFTINGSNLLIDSAVDYAAQAEYKIRVQVTDSGSPAASYAAQFRVIVQGVSALALPNVPDVPAVLAGERITVPLSFAPNGNNVVTMTFHVNYSTTCLQYVGLGGIQSGFADTVPDANDDGVVDVDLTTAGSAPLARGNPVSLVFTGKTGCPEANSWTSLAFASAPTMTGAGDVSFATSKSDGQLIVLDNDARGDCNASGSIDAGDFAANALEYLDSESTDESGAVPHKDSWLWTPLGEHAFSARGCDANADRMQGSADLQCTILLFFGSTCGDVQAAANPSSATMLMPYAVDVTPGAATSIPLVLQTHGQPVSAFAATIIFDPAVLQLDPTDADGSGVPDAVHFQMPPGMFTLARYNPRAGRLDLVAAGIVAPLPQLADGALVTVDFLPAGGAGGTATALRLDNLSLGSTSGTHVPVVPGELKSADGGASVFLPVLLR